MKAIKIYRILLFLLSIILGSQLLAGSGKVFEESYPQKEKLKIELVLGSCTIKKSTDDKIHVMVNYTYDDENFEIKVKEKERSLHLEEKFYGRNSSGDSEWTIYLPDKVKIDYKCATGGLFLDQVTVDIDGKTGTGDISVIGSSGEFELKSGTGNVIAEKSQGVFDFASGTGDISLKNCNGEFDAKSGTGDVQAVDLTIIEEAAFKSGTGNAEVSDPSGEDFDLSVKAGTGDATLVLDKTPLQGYFEFQANSSGGDIISPIGFDNEQDYDRTDDSYTVKSFTRGKSTPRYFLSTGSGTAELKK